MTDRDEQQRRDRDERDAEDRKLSEDERRLRQLQESWREHHPEPDKEEKPREAPLFFWLLLQTAVCRRENRCGRSKGGAGGG